MIVTRVKRVSIFVEEVKAKKESPCFYLQPIHFTLTFVKIKSSMTQITIDKKKYVIIPEKEYQQLLKNAA
nr:hypothetical protein [Bacteroidota bacterium]